MWKYLNTIKFKHQKLFLNHFLMHSTLNNLITLVINLRYIYVTYFFRNLVVKNILPKTVSDLKFEQSLCIFKFFKHVVVADTEF